MRKLALFATLAAVVLAHGGCARWTLRPMHAQRSSESQPMPDKLGSLSALMNSQAKPPGNGEATPEQVAARSPELGLDKIPPDLALARLNERQGDERKAHELYVEYIAKHPQHPLAYHRLGVMAARKSKLDEAEQHLRKAIEVAPPSVELLGDMGYLCYLQSRFDEAEHYLLQAIEQAPNNASATNNLAIVYGARGDFDKSLRYFSRVNDDAKSHANVAFTMTQQGRLEDARNEYLTALSIDKTLRSAANALVQIESKRKVAEAAAKRSGRQQAAPVGSDGVIELSSTRADPSLQPSRSQESAAPRARFEPVARSQPASATPPAETHPLPPPVENLSLKANAQNARSATVDAADRLMPLPALPASENETSAPTADEFAAQGGFTPPLDIGMDAANGHDTRQLSRFSANASPSHVPADVDSRTSEATERAENIFSQARQVSWDADALANETKHAGDGFNNIPIPTTEPKILVNGRDSAAKTSPQVNASRVQPAVAVETAKSAASAVRPAVHVGLSDASASAATAKPASGPVKSQFSDFGTAPARLNVSSAAAPLNSPR